MRNFKNNIDRLVSKVLNEEIENKVKQISEEMGEWTEIEVDEEVAKAFLFGEGVSLSDLVDSINAVGATSSDLVAILEALREAGALNAELIVI